MRGLYPAFVGICAYCLVASVIQVVWRDYHVPRMVLPVKKPVTGLVVPAPAYRCHAEWREISRNLDRTRCVETPKDFDGSK